LAKDPTFVPSEKETDTLESLFAWVKF
jgi:hypothetical protein